MRHFEDTIHWPLKLNQNKLFSQLSSLNSSFKRPLIFMWLQNDTQIINWGPNRYKLRGNFLNYVFDLKRTIDFDKNITPQ